MRLAVLYILLFFAGTSGATYPSGCQKHLRVAHLAPRFRVQVQKNFSAFSPLEKMEWGDWEENLRAEMLSLNPILQKHWQDSVYPSRQRSVNPIPLLGRYYQVTGVLGEGNQGSVFLVQDGDTEIALKVFHSSAGLFSSRNSDYRLSLMLYIELERLGAPVVTLLGADHDRRTLALQFAKGYVRTGVRKLFDAGLVSADQFLAFNYFSFLHQSELKSRYSPSIDWQIEPAWFNPMEENLLYDPWAEQWIIIDPM